MLKSVIGKLFYLPYIKFILVMSRKLDLEVRNCDAVVACKLSSTILPYFD